LPSLEELARQSGSQTVFPDGKTYPIDQRTAPDPPERLDLNIDLAYAFHAGPDPHCLIVDHAFDAKVIPPVRGGRYRGTDFTVKGSISPDTPVRSSWPC